MSAVLEYPQRHAISAGEYLRMGEAGVFAPEARLELIEGEIIERAPIGSPHAGTVMILNRLFNRAAGETALVLVQSPVIVGERSVPQPDLALLKPRADNYTRSHPAATDVLLVVEVADTTRAFDIGTKVPLYARSAIAEAWVVDLQERVLHAYRDPGADGYRTSLALKGDESISPLALPALVLSLAELFPT